MTRSAEPPKTPARFTAAGRGVPTAPFGSRRREEADQVTKEFHSASLPQRLQEAATWISTALLYAASLATFLRWTEFIRIPSPSLDSIVALVATAATLLSAARRLPFQNVLLAGAVIAVGGSLTGLLAVRAGVWEVAHVVGPRLLGILPWWVPCAWVVIILTSRGVALLILQTRSQSPRFGFEVLALTVGLALLLQVGLGAYLGEQKYGGAKDGDAFASFAICFVATVLILLLVTPILINKKPASSRPDYHPLIVGLPLVLLCVM